MPTGEISMLYIGTEINRAEKQRAEINGKLSGPRADPGFAKGDHGEHRVRAYNGGLASEPPGRPGVEPLLGVSGAKTP